MSCADTQLLLILAVGGAFYSTTQCNISLYHVPLTPVLYYPIMLC
jgi:hypothetical protein